MAPRNLAALLLALSLAWPAAADMFVTRPESLEPADRVVLRKSERELVLYRAGRPLKSYRVSLGLRPEGHKEREGDFRTPEGRYMLTWRNPQSEFFLSIAVSYPNAEDLANARRNGWRPGGSIMIHGLPNVPRHPRERYLSTDWTDGCIAVSNEDMLEIWLLTGPDTPIEILP
jgi:murein L,D-transpeptidase YafK